MIVSLPQWLRRWDRLTEPKHDLQTPEARRKARALASLLLILIPLLLIDLIMAYSLQRSALPFACALPTLIGAYVISRTRFFLLAGFITIFVLYALPFAGVQTSQPVVVADIFLILKYPLLNIIIVYFTFPKRVVLLVVLNICGILALNALRGNFSLASFLLTTNLVLTVIVILLILMLVRRDDSREYQRAEASIRKSEERYRILSNLVSDYAYAVRIEDDGSTTTEWLAGAVEAILGYSASEAGALLPEQIVHPEDRALFRQRLERLRAGNTDITEYRVVTRSGQVRWLRDYGYGVYDEQAGRVTAYYGAAQDITERRLAHNALRESEARFRAISEANVIAIVITRVSDNVIVYCNDQAATLAGTSADALIGMKGSLFTASDDDYHAYISELAEKGIVSNLERILKRIDGGAFWANVSAQSVILNGEPVRLAALIDITERKNAEAALKQSRARYETLVNSIDGVVWESEVETHSTTFISRQVESLLGYPVERFYEDATFWRNRIHRDDVEAVTEVRDRAIAERRSFQQEYRMIAAPGYIVWIRDIVTMVLEADQPIRLRGLAINITASKEAQTAEHEERRLTEALRLTTATISTTLDLNEVLDRILAQLSLVAPIKTVDIMLIEDGVARIVRSMGYDEHESEMLQVRLPVETTPNLRWMVETGQPLIIRDTTTFEDWVDVKPSRWIRSVIGAPIRLEWQTIGFLSINSDTPNALTPVHAQRLQAFADHVAIAIRNARLYGQVQRYAEELESLVQERTAELDVERRRLRFILDSSGEGVFYSEGMHFHYVNNALCRVMGFSREELVGQPVTLLVKGSLSSQDRRRLHMMLNKVRYEGIWRGEVRLRRKDGSVFDAGLTISLVGASNEKPLRAVTIVRDISKEKLLQAQRSRLVAHASHELRTPITNLKTRLYLLRRRPEALDYHLGILDEVTDRMKKLVEDLLDISRLERGAIPLNRARLQVQPLVERIVQVQQPEAERKQQSLTLDMPSLPLYVYADAERLTQVITNLLTNAINYTPVQGSIRVPIEIDAAEKAVLIHIQDTGVGISHENLPHIFQPFFRVMSEVEGTGLGLSIAKEIIEMHDGSIEVQSQFGVGSTFTIRLSLLPQPAATNAK